ncbi:MAG: UV DNA damage repair endonuclease UvsE [Anaerolineae bacterium]
MRLGFAVKVLGEPGLRSHDSRRWQNSPHLSVSLAYLRDLFAYLGRAGISMYRMASQLVPYATHPGMPEFHGQVEECARELAALGEQARAQGLRLSFHPSQYVVLNAPDEALAARGATEVEVQAQVLEAMGLGPEAVVVVHVGGVYEGHTAARERFVRRTEALSARARSRLVVENDERAFSVADVLWVHQRTGMRVVFDYLHHLNNPGGMDVVEAALAALQTWPASETPKVHFSSPRTEMRVVRRQDPETGRQVEVLQPPLWTQHSDYVNPFEFIAFLRRMEAEGARSFDVMLEAKAKDLALLRLREDLARLAPEWAARLRADPFL